MGLSLKMNFVTTFSRLICCTVFHIKRFKVSPLQGIEISLMIIMKYETVSQAITQNSNTIYFVDPKIVSINKIQM